MNERIENTYTRSGRIANPTEQDKENADDVVEDDDDAFPAMHDAFQTRKAWKD